MSKGIIDPTKVVRINLTESRFRADLMIDQYRSEIRQLTNALEESENDRAARLEQIVTLKILKQVESPGGWQEFRTLRRLEKLL